ncbi:EpsG-like putative glucosyltransferase [Pseudogracilibacillus auburnensis]|uniref:EpsG-like putative glucosyltransferase n=1 Tax=Pseudogracilibacillus auburnensis TaxID=1494959 RepID=A0A2V3VKC1_9BACI|nr:EpsG family protein [Pseudogracilibacillus auburnensis]PXW80495.1 EpsG-like putative glucosyltransferase [Pseudogracilibacillus auburnensis]
MEDTNKVPVANKYRKRFYYLFTFVVGLILALRKIPWATDDQNYLNYVTYSHLLFSNTVDKALHNPLFILVNEPIWLLLNNCFNLIFEPETVIRIFIFFSAVSVLYALGKITNYSFLTIFFFLFLVQIIKNHILHLRQGLAVGIFLLGFTREGKKGILLRFITPFIHTSFWFVLFIEVFEKWTKNFFTLSARLVIFIVSAFSFVFTIPFLMELSGDRRIKLYAGYEAGSYYGFLLWLLMGLLFFLLVKKNETGIIGRYAIILYVLTYFFIDFGARLFENYIPIIVAAILMSNKESKVILVFVLIIYGGITWYSWDGFSF